MPKSKYPKRLDYKRRYRKRLIDLSPAERKKFASKQPDAKKKVTKKVVKKSSDTYKGPRGLKVVTTKGVKVKVTKATPIKFESRIKGDTGKKLKRAKIKVGKLSSVTSEAILRRRRKAALKKKKK